MKPERIIEADWSVGYSLTDTAGVKLHLVDYKGKRVLWEASLPYVTVDHQRASVSPEDKVLEAHGPWWLPLGGRTLLGAVRVQRFRGGFEIVADYASGPYRYTQLYRFHADGRFSPWLTIHGPGLHAAHTYHPHWRFDFDLAGAGDDAFEYFTEGRWARVGEEGWFPYTGEQAPEGHVWRQVDFSTGAQVGIRPNYWEDAEVFALRFHEGEWAPFTPRSALGEQPFPAAYVGNEPLDGHDVLLWYVGHVHFDAAFPFTAGPTMRVTGL